jgi:hypothetical protein
MTKLKIVSNNKVRANRANAKKSTGPKLYLEKIRLVVMLYLMA